MNRMISAVVLGVTLASAAVAQTPANDPSAKLKEVLPADVADRVLAKIAEARARQLPAAALENRALKFAARGVKPEDIERSVSEQSDRMVRAKLNIERGRRGRPANSEEIDAGAEAMRMGVDGAKVSELAKSAPSGRSLAVPLFVIGSLVDRGLPSDQALARVLDRIHARATDADLEKIPGEVAVTKKPATTGRELADTKRPAAAGVNRPGGAPSGVAGNAGAGTRPTSGTMPQATKRGTTKRP